MSFLKKITETVSKGVSTATEKAQQTVEITRLNAQISARKKEIEKKLAAIGEAVFDAYLEKDLSKAEQTIIPICETIVGLRKEIAGMEDRIRELRNEKECVCGTKVPFDTRFCPNCGRKFEEPVHAAVEVVETVPERAQAAELPEEEQAAESPAGHAEAAEPQVLPRCGNCGADLLANARFCPGCGHPVQFPN